MEKSRTHNFFYNPYTIGIIIALFTVFVTILIDANKSKAIFSTISFVFNWLVVGIIAILTYRIPIYAILLFLFVLVFVLIVLGNIYFGNGKSKLSLPKFINYKTDTLKNFKWSWDWRFNSLHNYWEIKDLNIHCPKCDTKMLTYESYSNYIEYKCPRCSFLIDNTQHNFEPKHIIDALIKDNLDKMENANVTK